MLPVPLASAVPPNAMLLRRIPTLTLVPSGSVPCMLKLAPFMYAVLLYQRLATGSKLASKPLLMFMNDRQLRTVWLGGVAGTRVGGRSKPPPLMPLPLPAAVRVMVPGRYPLYQAQQFSMVTADCA